MSGFFPQAGFATTAKPRTPRVTDNATALWSANAYKTGSRTLVDLTGRGNHLTANAQMVYLPFTGSPYVYLPDAPGNKIVRDSDSVEITTPGTHLEGCEVLSATQVRDAEGETWTLTRSTDAYEARTAIVDRTMLLFGRYGGTSSAWASASGLADLDAATHNFTAALAMRRSSGMGSGAQYMTTRFNRDGSKDTLAGGYALSSGRGIVEQATDSHLVHFPGYTEPAGEVVMVGLVIDQDAGEIRTYINDVLADVVEFSSPMDFTGRSTFYLGRAEAVPSTGTFEFFAAAIFHAALGQSDLTQLAGELGVGQDF